MEETKDGGEIKQIQIRILVPLLSSSVWPVLVSFKVFIFLTMCLCTPVSVRVCACERSTQGGQKRAEMVAGSCELPGVGSAKRTQVLCKNNRSTSDWAVSPPTWVSFLNPRSLSFIVYKMGITAPLDGEVVRVNHKVCQWLC